MELIADISLKGKRNTSLEFRGHYNQTLLCNKRKKVEDALRARFDPLACLTHSLAKYVNHFIFFFT
jgi:hypothetical protein